MRILFNKVSFIKCIFVFLFLWSASLTGVINFSGKNSTLKLDDPSAQLILDTQLVASGGAIILGQNTASNSALGQEIIAQDLQITIGGCSSLLTGTFDPTGSDAILLAGSCALALQEGSLDKPIFVSGANNSVSGTVDSFSFPITLQDSQTTLDFWLKSPVNQPIVLNNGTINLNSNLNFTTGAMFQGLGVINSNGRTVSGVAGVLASPLTFNNGVVLELDSTTGVTVHSSSLTFNGAGQTSLLNGNGSTVTLQNGGQLVVGPHHTLILNNVFVKGLDSFANNVLSIDSTAVVKLGGASSLALEQPYVHSQGSIVVFGDDCKIVSPGFNFTVSGGATFTIDGTALFYDNLNQPNSNPVVFTNAFSQEILLNDGIIKSLVGQNGVNGIDGANIETDKYIDQTFAQLTTNFYLQPTTRIFVTNTTGFTKDVVLDGQGLQIRFPQGNQPLFFIDPNTNLTVTNMVFSDFNVSAFSLGAGSNLYFGDGTLIELASPWDINQSFNVSGNVTIDGRSSKITLVNDDALLVQPLAALTLKNTTVYGAPLGAHGGRLRVVANLVYPTSIILDNSNLFLDSNYNFSAGSIEVTRDCRIFGEGKIFSFTSNGSISIDTGSSLTVDRTVTFSYAPAVFPTTNANPYQFSGQRFVFQDPTSILRLRGCTLLSTATAVSFTPLANLLVEDTVSFVSTGTAPGQEFDISSQANITLLPAANLNLFGVFNYS